MVQPDFVLTIEGLTTSRRRMHFCYHVLMKPLIPCQPVSGAQWFSTLDLVSGYWQVEVVENDREKIAFTTHEGLFK